MKFSNGSECFTGMDEWMGGLFCSFGGLWAGDRSSCSGRTPFHCFTHSTIPLHLPRLNLSYFTRLARQAQLRKNKNMNLIVFWWSWLKLNGRGKKRWTAEAKLITHNPLIWLMKSINWRGSGDKLFFPSHSTKTKSKTFHFNEWNESWRVSWNELKCIITVQLLEQEYTCCLQ